MKKYIVILIILVLFGCKEIETEYDYTARKVETQDETSIWIFEGEFAPPLLLSNEQDFRKLVFNGNKSRTICELTIHG